MGRALILALVALALGAPPAAAAPIVGVGEQYPQIFADQAWHDLGLRDVRLLVSWNATTIGFERREIDAYMAAAERSGARLLVAFSRSRTATGPEYLPPVATYRRAFRAFPPQG